MALLTIFAFIAGAATALSPCALPVLPVVFSAGATGGRRRPAGIATGLALSFTFAVVVLVYVISALGLPDDLLRTLAIVVLLVFGLSLLVPQAAMRVEYLIGRATARGSAVASRSAGAPVDGGGNGDGNGFFSGLAIGASLGFVYAPCAGPILAGVITATASQDLSAERLVVALAYGVGSALTFFGLMLGGRRLIAPLARRSQRLQMGMGVTMVLVAIAMFADLDTRFQTEIASSLPAALVNPTGGLERSNAIRDDLARTRDREGAGGIGSRPLSPEDMRKRQDSFPGDASPAGTPSDLPILGTAPGFSGIQKWFNTENGQPLTIEDLRGKVVLVDFWTYTCINCIRTLPHLKSWWSKYSDDGLVIVGVHTPEFPFERSAGNVRDAIEQSDIRYPVGQDNEYSTWNAYGNQYWPAKYLIDAAGEVRYTHFGEGEYDVTESAIRELLAEAGSRADGSGSGVRAETATDAPLTPETYLGYDRAERVVGGRLSPGVRRFDRVARLPRDHFGYSGRWRIRGSSATAAGAARIDLRFFADKVFLVLGSPGRTRSMRVLLDGKPLPAGLAGEDVTRGIARIGKHRLYRLIDLKSPAEHTLTLLPEKGVSGYAFTFG